MIFYFKISCKSIKLWSKIPTVFEQIFSFAFSGDFPFLYFLFNQFNKRKTAYWVISYCFFYVCWTNKWKRIKKYLHIYLLHFAIYLALQSLIYPKPKFSFCLKMPVGETLIVFILFNALVVRLSIKPILFLLVSNGSASIANIVFL